MENFDSGSGSDSDSDLDFDSNTFASMEKHYKKCVEYYGYVKSQSENYNISQEDVKNIFDVLLSDNFIPMYMDNKTILDGVNFYNDLFNKIIKIKSYMDIIDVIEYFFVISRESEHLMSKYNLVEFLMKISIHLIWKLVYKFAPRLHPTPEEALNDIIYPIEASQRETKKIIKLLEKKHNITIISDN
jgi:hypothetical protein